MGFPSEKSIGKLTKKGRIRIIQEIYVELGSPWKSKKFKLKSKIQK